MFSPIPVFHTVAIQFWQRAMIDSLFKVSFSILKKLVSLFGSGQILGYRLFLFVDHYDGPGCDVSQFYGIIMVGQFDRRDLGR